MGVCIGACAKVEKMGGEIKESEKKQIEQNLNTNGF